MRLPTKRELVAELEGLIGLRLRSLDRMTKEDLHRLRAALSEPGTLLTIGLRSRRGEIATIGEAMGLPQPPVEPDRMSAALGDPLRGLSLLLEIGKKLGERR